uniref:Putative membrane protein n=1 Tax=Streptomyces violaceoruber TaxID=1935 RepID=Q849K9_STRVN|nr:putative membrane protein [Streptomyces violaceoruber]
MSFPTYASTTLSTALRRHISKATDDDLLAAYLHWMEGAVALDFAGEAHRLVQMTQTEQDHLGTLVAPPGTPYTGEHQRAHAVLRSALNETRRSAEGALRKAQNVWCHLAEQTSHDLTRRYRDEACLEPVGLECLGALKEEVTCAELHLRKALVTHQHEMHRLALLEQRLARFLTSDDSIALDDVHAMTPAAFEQAVASLARRDGCQLLREGGGARDLGADVIAVTQDGRRVVFQCKHRQAGLGKVGSPDIQTLNGTARPEHHADIVVAVTNGTFTKPAADFARTHDIHLLCRAGLQRWATWGEPLLSVLAPEEETFPSASAS